MDINKILFYIILGIAIILAGVITWKYISYSKALEKIKSKNKKISFAQGEGLKNQKTSNFFQAMSFITVAILMFSGLVVSFNSIRANERIAQNQIDFMKQTSSTNFANLNISLSNNYPSQIKIKRNSLTNIYKFNLITINSGKVGTGKIRISSINEPNFNVFLEAGNVAEILAQSGNFLNIEMYAKGCHPNTEEKCDESKIPLGKYKLILNFECDFCIPEQRNFNYTVPLCIYKETSIECDK